MVNLVGYYMRNPVHWNRNELYARRNDYNPQNVRNNKPPELISFVYDSVFDLSYNGSDGIWRNACILS